MHDGAMRARLLVGGLLIGLTAGGLVVPAVAPVHAQPDYPSEQDVEDARDAERAAGAAVVAAESRLVDVAAELDQAHIQAAKAVEAYNGARIALQEAEDAAQHAREKAAEAAEHAADARSRLGQVAAASYQHGGDLARIGMLFSAADGEGLVDQMTAFRSVTTSQAGAFREAAEATAAAEVAAGEADEAVAERERAALRAEEAHAAAERLVQEHERMAEAAESERQALLEDLAVARGTTVALEEQRQRAAQEEEAAERERDAREEDDSATADDGEDADQDESDPQPPTLTPSASSTPSPTATRTPPEPSPTPSTPSATPSSTPTATPTRTPTPTPSATRTPSPTPTPTPTPPPDPPTGAEAAVAYAYKQIGKPYLWGGSGPDAFDCSGLTMRAWEAGGKSLPHWSVAQAQMVTRISYSQMRPGDLVFWSDNGAASGVHHVGLYIGDGKMIHAPRPGKNVEIQSVFYWHDPAFYGRLP